MEEGVCQVEDHFLNPSPSLFLPCWWLCSLSFRNCNSSLERLCISCTLEEALWCCGSRVCSGRLNSWQGTARFEDGDGRASTGGKSQLPSPHHSSLRKSHGGCSGPRWGIHHGGAGKKRKESRPESLSSSTSPESETLDEEHRVRRWGSTLKEEEGDDFLDCPMDDGESLWGHLLKATGRRPSEDLPEARLTYCLLIHFFSRCCSLHPASQQYLLRIYCGSLLGNMEENSTFFEIPSIIEETNLYTKISNKSQPG